MEALCVSLVVAVTAVVAVVGVVMYARSKKKIEEMNSAVERYELEKRAARVNSAPGSRESQTGQDTWNNLV